MTIQTDYRNCFVFAQNEAFKCKLDSHQNSQLSINSVEIFISRQKCLHLLKEFSLSPYEDKKGFREYAEEVS